MNKSVFISLHSMIQCYCSIIVLETVQVYTKLFKVNIFKFRHITHHIYILPLRKRVLKNICQAQVQSQIQVRNSGPKFRSQIQVPNPKSRGKGMGLGLIL